MIGIKLVLGMESDRYSIKVAKNGARIFYLDGKRIKREEVPDDVQKYLLGEEKISGPKKAPPKLPAGKSPQRPPSPKKIPVPPQRISPQVPQRASPPPSPRIKQPPKPPSPRASRGQPSRVPSPKAVRPSSPRASRIPPPRPKQPLPAQPVRPLPSKIPAVRPGAPPLPAPAPPTSEIRRKRGLPPSPPVAKGPAPSVPGGGSEPSFSVGKDIYIIALAKPNLVPEVSLFYDLPQAISAAQGAGFRLGIIEGNSEAKILEESLLSYGQYTTSQREAIYLYVVPKTKHIAAIFRRRM